MRLTAQEIVDRLLNVDNILDLKGEIKFYLGDVDIIVKQKDVVGNIMQEWLQGWLDKNDIEYAPSENSQMPPDFRMYAEEIQEKPYMLDVDYLIFGYDMNESGVVSIKNVWLKKVWQITRRMANYPINLQVKDGVIHKIRPGVWYSQKATDYAIFDCLEDFICAMEETTFKEPKLRDSIASTWLEKFQRNYKARYGHELNVPRWKDIKDKYDLASEKKIEKANELLERAKNNKQKIEARVLRYQQMSIEARTDRQRENASTNLLKAEKQLEAAIRKLEKVQEQYDLLMNS